MKKQKQAYRFGTTYSMLALCGVLLLGVSCEEIPRTLYYPETVLIKTGPYEVTDISQDRQRTYEMVVRKEHRHIKYPYRFSNMAGSGLDAEVYVREGGQISVPAQDLSIGDPYFIDFAIFEGMGSITPNGLGLEITLWTREDGRNFRHDLKAVYKEW